MKGSAFSKRWKGITVGCIISIIIITIFLFFSKIYPTDFISGLFYFIIFALGGILSILLVKTETIESTIYVAFIAGVIIGTYFVIYHTIYTLYSHYSIADSQIFLMKEMIWTQLHNFYEIVFGIIWYFLVITSINIFGGILAYGIKKLATFYSKKK